MQREAGEKAITAKVSSVKGEKNKVAKNPKTKNQGEAEEEASMTKVICNQVSYILYAISIVRFQNSEFSIRTK